MRAMAVVAVSGAEGRRLLWRVARKPQPATPNPATCTPPGNRNGVGRSITLL